GTECLTLDVGEGARGIVVEDHDLSSVRCGVLRSTPTAPHDRGPDRLAPLFLMPLVTSFSIRPHDGACEVSPQDKKAGPQKDRLSFALLIPLWRQAVAPGCGSRRLPQPPGAEDRRKDQRDNRHELDQDVERWSGRVLERVADRVADDRGRMRFGSFAAVLPG